MDADRVTGFRLSPLQQRFWTLQQRGLAAGLRVEALFTMERRLDLAALQAAADAIVQEHEILRTQFVELSGAAALQCIADRGHVPIEVLPVADFDPVAIWSQLRAAGTARLPLFQITLIASGTQTSGVHLSASPLIADRRSVSLLARRLMTICDGRAADNGAPLQYVDIAEWKHALIASSDAGDGRRFWASQPHGHGAPDPLPLSWLQPARDTSGFTSSRVGVERIALPSSAFAAAGGDAEAFDPEAPDPEPLEAAALACCGWVCARHASLDELTIGVVSDGRAEAETLAAIGPMTAILPVTVRLGGGERIEAVRTHIANQLVAARAWQDLLPAGEPHVWPLAFEYVDERAGHAADTGTWRLCAQRSDSEPYALKFSCIVTHGGITLMLDIDRAVVVNAEEARRLLAQAASLLRLVVSSAGEAVGPLDRMAEPLARETDDAFNAGPAPSRSALSRRELSRPAALVNEAIERQVRESPDAVAIVDSADVHVTFDALNRRANRTARFLRSLGLTPEERVGVHLPRSVWMVVSVLAVMKAGGAFVPLEGAPPDRIRRLARGCQMRFILAETVDGLDVGDAAVQVIGLADQWSAMTGLPASDLPSRVCGANLAYVLFTSGSTGTPKGVAVPHDALANYLAWARSAYDRPDTAGSLLHSPLDFDFTATALFLPLLCGRPVRIAPRQDVLSSIAREMASAADLTFVKLTPAHLRALAALAPMHRDATGLLVIGGENLTSADLAWFADAPLARLVNEYGPTEATVGCCVYEAAIGELLGLEAGRVPIGRPIANARLHLLSPMGDLVMPGAPGEIAIGGAGLARGYIDRPDLTAAAFVPDPHAPAPGERQYRTGDLARLQSDGQLVFLGRFDTQIKVRGVRIELEEIALAARELPGVTDSVALTTSDTSAADSLALIVCARDLENEPFALDAIRAGLTQRLPALMVPSIVVRVPAMPLTAHGKIDQHALRRELPALMRAPSRPPATDAERDFVEIWSAVLKQEGVGIDDNFFAIGGDSIRSIQVSGLARARGYNVPLTLIMQAPTIRELAASAGRVRTDAVPAEVRRPFALLSPEERAQLPADAEDAYPMTAMQEGMLFHSEWEAHRATYHDVVAVHLEAPYDRGALNAALRDTIAAHPILRTIFDLHRFSQPMQLVLAHAEPEVEELDLRELDADRQETAIRSRLSHQAARQFAWDERPPHRVGIHRRGEGSFQFTLGFHHALLDGWSTATLLLEVLQRYRVACGLTQEPPPAPPTSRFRDYVHLERTVRESADARMFWQRYLDDAPRTAYGRAGALARTSGETAAVHRAERRIASDTHQRLLALSRDCGVPLKSVLLAAHVAVIQTLMNRDEIVTGVVSNGRVDDVDGDRVLGLFLNTLPLRASVRGRCWRDLVAELYAHEKQSAPHRRFPLADMLREAGTTDLFDTAFNFVHYHLFGGLEAIEGVRVLRTYAFEETNFALLASLVRGGASDRLTLLLDADTARVPPARLDTIADLYERALEALAADAARPILDTAMLPPSEAARLRAWSAAAAMDGRLVRADRLVLEAAARHGDRVAVVCGDQHVSYGAFVARARRVARRLARHGVAADQVVLLDLDRGVEAVTIVLGVLLAGAAYLAVDRQLPSERRRFIVADCNPRAIVTDTCDHDYGEWRDRLHTPQALLADDGEPVRHKAPPPANDSTDLDSACYLVYTSGSTGVPKGIVMTHRPVAALTRWQVDASGARTRTLQSTSLSFDVSFQEIFSTWAAGGTLVLIAEAARGQPEHWWQLLRHEEVERLFLPCAALRQLVTAHPHTTDRLRLSDVITAGDVLQLTPDLRAFFADHPAIGLANHYGPAETHVVTALAVPGTHDTWPTLPGIGSPVGGAAVHLVDDRQRPVPIGTIGELYIGGDAVSRGYMNRPDLTAERFVPDACGGRPGARLYRTGDLARLDQDGGLTFIGRQDHQVKILGHRIELGEIETALVRVPAIAEAVVEHVVAPDGEGQLLACVVPRAGHDLAIDETRRHLQRSLPRYMVPTRFVILDTLPRTITGKIDRRRLPRAAGEAARPRPAAPPATATEAMLLASWRRALQRDDIGVDDDFFDAGGHSLTATRIIVALRAARRVSLPIKAVFDHRTVRSLARVIDAVAATQSDVVQRVPRDGRLMLAPQQENWWYAEYLTGRVTPNNIHFRHRLSGPLQPIALEQAAATLQRRHEGLRTRFVRRDDGEGAPVIDPPDTCDLRMALIDVSPLPPDARARTLEALSREDADRPFDLTRDALCRVTLVRVDDDDHVVLFTTHHLVCDGWSADVLAREWSTVYAAAVAGKPAALPPLPFQYVDFARWQRDWIAGPEAESQRGYWRRQLAPPLPDLLPAAPFDPETGASPLSVRMRLPFALGAAAVEAVRHLARDEHCTPFAAILAAFDVVLFARYEQPDVRVGTFTANRRLPGVEQIVGLFTNVVCLRTRVDEAQAFRSLVRTVQATIAEASEHEDLPFELLVRSIDAERQSPSRLFQVAVLWHARSAPLSWPGVVQTPQPHDDEGPSMALARTTLDLKVDLVESDTGVTGAMTFRVGRLDPADVRGLIEALERTLIGVADDASVTVAWLMRNLSGTGLTR